VSGSFAKVFAPNLFSFNKRLGSFARFKISPDALPIDIVSGDFESVLSVNAFGNYLQRVRSLAPCSYETKRLLHAATVAYLALNGNNKFDQSSNYT
jgi:hypothetical protein